MLRCGPRRETVVLLESLSSHFLDHLPDFHFPSVLCSRPHNSSALPCENLPQCCLTLPFSSFQEPFICSLFIGI